MRKCKCSRLWSSKEENKGRKEKKRKENEENINWMKEEKY